MSFLNNKKGVGNVIAMVSLVLMGILAVATVGTYVNVFIERSGSQLAPVISCIEMSGALDVRAACQDLEGRTRVTVQRNLRDFDLSRIEFIVTSGQDKTALHCGESCGDCFVQGIGATKEYFLNVGGGEKVEVYVGACKLDEKEIVDC